jgi:uncharacterized CHY-type Zn-finger protein
MTMNHNLIVCQQCKRPIDWRIYCSCPFCRVPLVPTAKNLLPNQTRVK